MLGIIQAGISLFGMAILSVAGREVLCMVVRPASGQIAQISDGKIKIRRHSPGTTSSRASISSWTASGMVCGGREACEVDERSARGPTSLKLAAVVSEGVGDLSGLRAGGGTR